MSDRLGELRATAQDRSRSNRERREAVQGIADLDSEAATAALLDLAGEMWMGDTTQKQVVDRLCERAATARLVRLLGSGCLSQPAHAHGLAALADLDTEQQLRVVGPYVAAPTDCDPSALLDLMRLLARGSSQGADAIAVLAHSSKAGEVVRAEARAALDHERPELLARGESLSVLDARTEIFSFSASRLNAGRFQSQLRAYAHQRNIPFHAEVGSGLLRRTVTVTITASPSAIDDFAQYAKQFGAVWPARRSGRNDGAGPADGVGDLVEQWLTGGGA